MKKNIHRLDTYLVNRERLQVKESYITISTHIHHTSSSRDAFRASDSSTTTSNNLSLGIMIPWCQTVQALINEHSQLEVSAFWRP